MKNEIKELNQDEMENVNGGGIVFLVSAGVFIAAYSGFLIYQACTE